MADVMVPTMGGIQRSFGTYGKGLIAGAGYSIITRFTGSGLIGSAIAAAGAGSMVPGSEGTAISAVAGWQAGQQLLQNGGGLGDLLANFGMGGKPSQSENDDDLI